MRWLCAVMVLFAGCTEVLGPRRQSADLSEADGSSFDLATTADDLAGSDFAGSDFAGADLAGPDLAPAPDLFAGPDLIGADLVVVAGVPSAAQSTLQAAPASVTADGSSNTILTVTVRDGAGTPVVGQPVTMVSASGTSNTVTPSNGITNGFGVFNATLSSTKAETKTVTATVGSFMLQTNVQFVPGSPQSGNSTLSVSPSSIAAGGATANITVTVRDGNANPVSGQMVTLGATGTGNTLSPLSGGTDGSGVFTATISSTVAEMKSITATVASFNLNQSLTVVPGQPSAAMSSVSASPTSGLPANGAGASTVTVTVRDAGGNLVPGASVSLSATGGGTTFTPQMGTANVSGVFSSQLTATMPGMKTLTATAGGVGIAQMPVVTFDMCPAPIALTLGAAPLAGSTSTAGATNVYHPVCALPTDAPERVYGFTLGSRSSVIVDRSASMFAAVSDLRPGGACSTDGMSLGCSTARYLYCNDLMMGPYQLAVDGISGAAGSFNLGVSAAPFKGALSYGVVTRSPPPAFTSIGTLGAAVAIPIVADGSPADSQVINSPLPIAFKYFNTTYAEGTPLVIYQAGYLSFGSSVVNTFQNVCLPATGSLPADTIVPYWGRLASRSPANGNRGRVLTLSQGTAPNRTFTVEWDQMDGLDAAKANFECVSFSVQVILDEASGQIEFRYNPIDEDRCGNNTTTALNFSVGGHQTIGLRTGTVTVASEQQTCNGNPVLIGSCTRGGGTDPCMADKSYVFVPRAARCP